MGCTTVCYCFGGRVFGVGCALAWAACLSSACAWSHYLVGDLELGKGGACLQLGLCCHARQGSLKLCKNMCKAGICLHKCPVQALQVCTIRPPMHTFSDLASLSHSSSEGAPTAFLSLSLHKCQYCFWLVAACAASGWWLPALQVVDTFATWRQRVADQYYGGNLERLMAESGDGGVKLLLLGLMEKEHVRPGEGLHLFWLCGVCVSLWAHTCKCACECKHVFASVHCFFSLVPPWWQTVVCFLGDATGLCMRPMLCAGGSYRVVVKPPNTDFASALAAAQLTQSTVSSMREGFLMWWESSGMRWLLW